MESLDWLVRAARELVESIVREAADQLLAGADIEQVRERFVVTAIRTLEEVELQALLAASGDLDALTALRDLVGDLVALRADLKDEREG
jgi:hypothetical protein